ncbi:MAG: hypothetical protein JEZ07_15350 [Phycisphaerae bacterium]|nr:hypothetical protein [Phycisphaerae bacterium]
MKNLINFNKKELTNKFWSFCRWIAKNNSIAGPSIFSPTSIKPQQQYITPKSHPWLSHQPAIDRRYNDYQEKRTRSEQGRK